MGTIAQKVQWTWDCKRDIEQALLERGIALPQDFRDFGDAIRSIGRKPYDSEVEYLESTGTQYIDTGIVPTQTTRIEFAYLLTQTPTDSFAAAFGCMGATGGATSSENLYSGFTLFNNPSVPVQARVGRNTAANIVSDVSVAANTRYEGEVQFGRMQLNGAEYTQSGSGSWITMTRTICTHTANDDSSTFSRRFVSARFFSFSIYDGSILVRDFQPVRKNGVGYLYDKVSGKLFGNTGTGAFLYGDDVREVEYIESTGTQFIDTGISMPSNSATGLKVVVDSYGVCGHGIIHNNVAGGTWLGTAGLSDIGSMRIYKNTYSSRITRTYPATRNLHVWDGSIGFSENGELVESFTAGVGSDNITGIHWFLGRNYDFYTSGPVVTDPPGYRIYSAQMWLNGVLVRDFIPYRIGNKGCLYDKVSGKFFTNAGTGDFTAGPDALHPTTTSKAVYDAKVEYIESTGTQFIDTGIIPDGKGTSVECVFSNSVNGNFSPVLWTRGENATDRAFCFEVEQRQQARWDYADYGAMQIANTVPLNERTALTIKDGTATVNGVQMTRASKEFTGAGPMILCNFCNYVNGVRQMISANVNPVRIYSCKVFSDGLLVRDFIPVRKDGRGCLCDLVTGRLFENAGTGVFKYGEDVVNLPADTEMLYDAEVEYLESTGTQYIDTGIDAAVDADMSIDAVSLNTGSTQFHAMGVFSTSSNSGYALFCSSTGMITGSVGSDIRVRANGVNWNTRRLVELKKGELIIDGTSYGLPSPMPTSLLPGNHIWLMGLNGVDITLPSHPGRLYGAKISVGSALVRDFQPVRKNGVGYLFDRVGRKLYGNAGTGAFKFGGDK